MNRIVKNCFVQKFYTAREYGYSRWKPNQLALFSFVKTVQRQYQYQQADNKLVHMFLQVLLPVPLPSYSINGGRVVSTRLISDLPFDFTWNAANHGC